VSSGRPGRRADRAGLLIPPWSSPRSVPLGACRILSEKPARMLQLGRETLHCLRLNENIAGSVRTDISPIVVNSPDMLLPCRQGLLHCGSCSQVMLYPANERPTNDLPGNTEERSTGP
jgi:hypothetical protein